MGLSAPRTIEVDRSSLDRLSVHLAASISADSPDLLIGIASGGVHVAEIVQRELNVKLVTLTLQRPATKAKSKLRAAEVLRRLPPSMNRALRWLEVEVREFSLDRFTKGASNQSSPLSGDPDEVSGLVASIRSARQIAIIDDTVDSGRTLLQARRIVSEINPAAGVTTAVLTSTWRRPPFEPDHCLHHRTLLRLPWSFDARGG